jgi:hypothetical protein
VGAGADPDLAVDHTDAVHDEATDRSLHIKYLDPASIGQLDHTMVGELTTRLGIERGPIEHQLDLVA